MEIVLNSRGKDANGRLLELDFDYIVEQLLDRERRQKLTSNDSNGKAIFTNNKNKGNGGNDRNNNNNYTPWPKCDDYGRHYDRTCWLSNPD